MAYPEEHTILTVIERRKGAFSLAANAISRGEEWEEKSMIYEPFGHVLFGYKGGGGGSVGSFIDPPLLIMSTELRYITVTFQELSISFENRLTWSRRLAVVYLWFYFLTAFLKSSGVI